MGSRRPVPFVALRRERRRVAAATAGVLMDKTLQLSGEVYMAMQARGFGGEVQVLSHPEMKLRDYAGLMAFLGLTALALWLGR